MEITKTEVFECQKCGSISKKKMDIEKCIKKHEKEDLQEKGSAEFRKLHSTLTQFMINNLNSLKSDDVGRQLISVCKLMGINLAISTIRGGVPKENYRNGGEKWEYAEYNVSGSLSRITPSEFKKIVIPTHLRNNFSWSFERLINPKDHASFGDIVDLLEGVESGGGGGGGNSFSYSIKLPLNSFPKLNKKWQALKEIRLKKISYLIEKERLKREYDQHRKPVILIADIEYQAIKSELDDIKEQIEALSLKSVEVATKVNSRVHELVSKDSPAYTTPDSSFEFDPELESELSQDLGV